MELEVLEKIDPEATLNRVSEKWLDWKAMYPKREVVFDFESCTICVEVNQ